ncbi:MAG: 30S ribosomal protein S16 [Deltaproteobacteria bacterium]|jgi:small subunit ribosomal protein S16|nr:30S ribosomal protein S16 [Deltaproteobacteria bacterium]MBK8236017.1 30S ribosomal protein S16 [Deltaproteobacteria bacterium]MBK8713641.1 30S ribosomal protein S16 [Deltaproteobacteria bacterium]MBP7288886.1 30S ribosomal protein S16 [Nannocystaceae bacterium]
MAVKIRLARAGAKKRPYYRIVATHADSPRDGRFLERLGTYDPSANPSKVEVNRPRLDYWLGVGALPSETVARLIKSLPAAT